MSDIDALLDQFAGAEKTEPSNAPSSAELKNFFDTELTSPAAQALPKAVAATGDNPDEAAKALSISKETGIPATIVAADPKGAVADHRSAEAGKYVKQSSALQNYVNEFPLGASISADDYKNLDNINLYAGAAFGVMPMDPALVAKLPPFSWVTGIYDLIKRVGDMHSGKDPMVSDSDKEIGLALSIAPLILGGTAFPKVRPPISSSAEINEFLNRAGHGPVETEGMRTRAEIDEFLRQRAERDGAPKLLEGPKPAPPEGLAPAAETMIKAGKMPTPGVDKLVDQFHIAQADRDLDTFDKIFELVNQSKTKERSPDAMEAFLSKTPLVDKNVSIPIEAVDKLYGKTEPGPNDALLGYEPGIADKIAFARETGTDLQIPMSRFVAQTDPTVYGNIKNDLRFREEGLTKEEAKEFPIEEEPVAKKEAAAPEEPAKVIPPEVQRVLDTPAGQLSAAVKKSFYFQPLFQNAKVIGMSEAEYAKYFNKIQNADEAAYQRLLDKEKRKAAKEQTLEWKVNEAETRSEVESDLRSRPDVAVDRFIRTGVLPTGEKIAPVKLNRAVVSRFVKAGQADKAILDRYTIEGGVLPDNIADQFGFNSGASMIRALSNLEKARGDLGPKAHFNQMVKDETQRRMEAKHGDLAANILEEAVDAALGEHNLDILHDELTALAKADGKEAPYTRAELEAYVSGKFKTLKAAEASFETFRRGSEKAGKAAEKALLAGKFDEAFKAKQQQILSVTTGKMARGFEKRQRQAKRLYDRYQDNRVLKNVDQGYTDQIHGILERAGLPTTRQPAELAGALQGKSLADFIYNKVENLGRIIPVDMELIGSGKKVGDFTTEEADNFHDSIKALDHNGKMEKQLQAGTEKLDHEIAVERAVTEMDKNKPRYIPRHPNAIQRLQSTVYHWDAMLIKMEQLFDWLDRNDPLGVFNEVVFRGLSEAKHLENDMLKELGQKVKALPATKEFNASLDERIDNTELLDWQNGEPMELTGRDLVAMMLNMGNRSNFEKLTAQYEYNGQMFQFDPMAVKGLVKANATKAHWDFVQAVWDLFESYWPQIEELSRDMAGVAPDKIERVPIKTEWGTYAGGYYPLRADANWVGPRHGATGVFGADRYFRAVPPKGYTMPRTGAAYPLDLNYSAIIPMMEQMVHDLAFRRPLAQAVKFLEDVRIKQAIQRSFGPEYLNQIKPWLEYVATTKRMNDEALTGINRMARWWRDRLVAVQLLYRASTIVKHTVAAAFDSFGESGMYTNKAAYLKDFSENTARLYGTPDGHRIISEMFEKSGELRNRMHDMDRDIGEAMDRTLGQSGIRAVATHYGGYGVSLLDLGSAIPTWYTHYKKAIALGYEEPDAVVIGDKAVRAAHGSAGPTDLAAIQRGGEVLRLFTVAYTFFSHSYNRVRAVGRETKLGFEDLRAQQTGAAFNKFASAAWRSLWYIVLLGAAEEAIAPIPTDRGHEGIVSFVGKGMAYQLSGTIPFLRDAVRALLYGKGDIAPTPLSSIYTTVGGALNDAYKKAAGQRIKDNFLREEIEALGYALKLPGAGQAGATAQYLWDLRHHRQTGENPYRFGRGVLFGKSHPERRLRR